MPKAEKMLFGPYKTALHRRRNSSELTEYLLFQTKNGRSIHCSTDPTESPPRSTKIHQKVARKHEIELNFAENHNSPPDRGCSSPQSPESHQICGKT